MNSLFGIPMTALMFALLVLLGFCLLTILWVALRRPVIFKLGLRNIPRRKAQTILIVIGLMLSTLIISAALGTGDTLNHSVSAEVYSLIGHVDEAVVYSQSTEGNVNTALNTKIDTSALTLVEQTLAGDPQVDGIMPILLEPVPVVDQSSGQAEPQVTIAGLDPSRIDQFGGLHDRDGHKIDLAALPEGTVVLSKAAAEDLDANVGDTLTIYYGNRPIPLTVAAIAPDSVLSGAVSTEIGGMAMALDRLQQLTNQPNALSIIAISNSGGVRDSLGPTKDVIDRLKPALAGKSLGYQALKQDLVDDTVQFAEIFTDIFLIMGLFSIASGILLIILIFTMLAAERRSEMGIERAVGTQRRQLIQQFVSEGTGYAIFAGIVGAALGVLAAIGIAYGMRLLFGQYFAIEPWVAPRSLVVAYCLGMVLTFAAVVISSWRISRLNITAAVRDIPEVSTPRRKWTILAGGIALLVLGGLMTVAGTSGSQAAPFFLGMSMLPFGGALVIRFLGAPSRPVYSLVGIYLLIFWLMPSNQFNRIFGKYDGGIEMFFLSGICLVFGATLIIVQNTDLLLAAVSKIGRVFRGALPAVRTAIAYPGAARNRTGLTIAMFCLVVFSLVMMATITENFLNLFLGEDANAGWQVRADALSANPIDDFEATLRANGIDTSGFTAMASVTTPHLASQARTLGGDWKDLPVRGMDENFISTSKLKFQQRAEGYATDADIIRALQSHPNLAVIDASAVPASNSFGSDPSLFRLDGLKGSDKVFSPIVIQVADPDNATPASLTIIGVIDSKIGSLYGLYASRATVDAIFPTTVLTSYYVALAKPDEANAVAKEIEKALLANGVQATSVRDELKDAQRQQTAFLYIFEGFMGLGLIVGVAAIGVIAFRSVVERRQQIGVLRAIGYQRSLVTLSFMIETGFVVSIGVLTGTALGLMLARNLFNDEDFAASAGGFVIPWTILAVIVVATIASALLMAWVPSRRAARIAPAEALRYE
ncbi:MAG TPA: FtsX-like permease family protein [Thermomicrobiales bacterium]|nr:FtsX-like permease family protein [Thermomicrobiales bacterium]